MRDYDTQELITQDPVLYLQKWIDYGFWMGKKISKDIYLTYRNQVTIEPTFDQYLQFIIHGNTQ